jgi:hypothetical protein
VIGSLIHLARNARAGIVLAREARSRSSISRRCHLQPAWW